MSDANEPLDPSFAKTQALQPTPPPPDPKRPHPARARLGAAQAAVRSFVERLLRRLDGETPRRAFLYGAAPAALLAFALGAAMFAADATPLPAVSAAARADIDPYLDALPEGSRSQIASAVGQGDVLGALGFALLAPVDGPPEEVSAVWMTRALLSAPLDLEVDALTALERARQASPQLAQEPTFIAAALRSFRAGRANRTQLLVADSPPSELGVALKRASKDPSWRVRHGAVGLLKTKGEAAPDPVGVQLLDVWQVPECDDRRGLAGRLLKGEPRDPRVVPVLLALSRQQRDDGCLEDVAASLSRANAKAAK